MRLLRNVSAVVLSCAMLVASALAQTRMVMAKQDDAPARIIETLHGEKDWLLSAKIQNQSRRTISAYKIGCSFHLPNGKTKTVIGPIMNVPAGIAPDAIYTVPAQAVTPNMQAERVVFFVAEVKFSNGEKWRGRAAQS